MAETCWPSAAITGVDVRDGDSAPLQGAGSPWGLVLSPNSIQLNPADHNVQRESGDVLALGHPFGNQATVAIRPIAVGPWLCVPTFRWVCLFEENEGGSRLIAALG